MKTRLCRRPAVCALLALAVAASAQPPGVDPEPILNLPPVTVMGKLELPKPEAWQYARIDGFEVLSNAPLGETNRLLGDFQKFRQALRIVRPAASLPAVPATLVLCGRQGAFGHFMPEDQRGYDAIVSLLLRDRQQAAIVADLETVRLQPDDISMMRLSGQSGRSFTDDSRYEGLEVEPHRQLYRQYARLLLTQGEGALPPWLLEGVTQMVMDMSFSDRSIRYGWIDLASGAPVHVGSAGPATGDVVAGTAGPMTAGTMISDLSGSFSVAGEPDRLVGDRPFPMVLARVPLLPMDQFFAMAADSSSARNPLGNSLWAKQAYAFVHLCQFRVDGKWRQPFDTFVRRLTHEPLSERLFQECFQMTYADMLKELHAYIRNPRHLFRDIRLTEEGRLVAADVEFREATQGEIGRIKGDAQRLAGRHEEALFAYRVAYARGERDPALLAALGVAEVHAGQTERARQFLEAAAKLGTDRPSAWVALARLRLAEAKVNPAEAGKLSARQIAAVFAPLLRARALESEIPEAYHAMAEAWELSAVAPTPANIHVLGEGSMQFPTDPELSLRTARLYARAGDPKNAAEVARMGLRFATDDAARRRFEDFLATLAPAATVPSGSPPGLFATH